MIKKNKIRQQLSSLGHQVNTLFCLIAAKRKKGRHKRVCVCRGGGGGGDKKNAEKDTTDFGRAVATSLCIKSKDKVIRQH